MHLFTSAFAIFRATREICKPAVFMNTLLEDDFVSRADLTNLELDSSLLRKWMKKGSNHSPASWLAFIPSRLQLSLAHFYPPRITSFSTRHIFPLGNASLASKLRGKSIADESLIDRDERRGTLKEFFHGDGVKRNFSHSEISDRQTSESNPSDISQLIWRETSVPASRVLASRSAGMHPGYLIYVPHRFGACGLLSPCWKWSKRPNVPGHMPGTTQTSRLLFACGCASNALRGTKASATDAIVFYIFSPLWEKCVYARDVVHI